MSEVKWFMLTLIGFVTLTIVSVVVIQGTDFFLYRAFAPKYEAVRRDTFEQSKAYNQGMAQDLQAMQLDYLKGNDAQKAAIGSIVVHRLADYDVAKLTPDLQLFVQRVRQDQAKGNP